MFKCYVSENILWLFLYWTINIMLTKQYDVHLFVLNLNTKIYEQALYVRELQHKIYHNFFTTYKVG